MIVNRPLEVLCLPLVAEPKEEPITMVVISSQQTHKTCFAIEYIHTCTQVMYIDFTFFGDTSIADLIDSLNIKH